MSMQERDTLVGLFQDASHAQQAVRALRQAGFTDEQIGVAGLHGDHAEGNVATHGDTMAEEGAIAGMATGAGVGALWGLGIMAGLLPGIGPAIAGGTLGVILSSAAAGAAAAGLAGALVGMGIPEKEAEFYENEVKSGRSLVTVRTHGRHADAVAIMSKFGAYDIDNQPNRTPDALSAGGNLAPTQPDAPPHTAEIPVRAEDVMVEDQTAADARPNRGGDFRMPVDADDVRIGDHGDVLISRPKPQE